MGKIVMKGYAFEKPKLNLDKVNSLEDCKKILNFLYDQTIKPLPEGIEYKGFSEVKEYFE